MIGFTAAEVGIKRHIVRMMPETEYLLKHIGSPPMHRMLEYLDRVPSKIKRSKKSPAVPKCLKKPLSAMMELRNDITHKGQPEKGKEALRIDNLEDMLLAVQDLLWLLDFYAGYAWAIDHVRQETVRELLGPQK